MFFETAAGALLFIAKPAQLIKHHTPEYQQSVQYTSTGIASYYSWYYHGRTTANGETFNNNALTAAHRTLPFNSRVRVTNLNTGVSVVVRINDRGPFISGRVIDLSAAAFSQIAPLSQGLTEVKLEVLN